MILPFLFLVAAATELRVEIPPVLYNEQNTNIELKLDGADLSEIVSVRTVLFTPSKRGPKFVQNLTHDDFEVVGNDVTTDVIYSLPTKKYLLGYSVELENETVDSELVEVDLKDKKPDFVKLVNSIVVLLGALLGGYLLYDKLKSATIMGPNKRM